MSEDKGVFASPTDPHADRGVLSAESWVVIQSGLHGDSYLVCEDVPGRLKPICAVEHGHPKAEELAALLSLSPTLLSLVQLMLEAIEGGNVDSPELGEPEVGIPMHKWHEEWEHYARNAIAKALNASGAAGGSAINPEPNQPTERKEP